MTKAKTTKTNNDTDSPIQVLKTGTCPTTSGKSTLGYKVGLDESGAIHLRIASNDGGGMFSSEWVSFPDIQEAIKQWPEEQGLTSMTFHKIFRGKSANCRLLEPLPLPQTEQLQGLMTWMFPHSYNTDPIPGLWDTKAKLTRRTPLQLILLNLDRPAQSGQSLGKPSHRNPAFGQEIFDIAMTQVKSVVEPDGIGNNIEWGAPSRNR